MEQNLTMTAKEAQNKCRVQTADILFSRLQTSAHDIEVSCIHSSLKNRTHFFPENVSRYSERIFPFVGTIDHFLPKNIRTRPKQTNYPTET